MTPRIGKSLTKRALRFTIEEKRNGFPARSLNKSRNCHCTMPSGDVIPDERAIHVNGLSVRKA